MLCTEEICSRGITLGPFVCTVNSFTHSPLTFFSTHHCVFSGYSVHDIRGLGEGRVWRTRVGDITARSQDIH
jgi:hypothetical protein